MSAQDPFEGFIPLRKFCNEDPHAKSYACYQRRIRLGELQAFKDGKTVYVRPEDLRPQPKPMPKTNSRAKRKSPATKTAKCKTKGDGQI